MLVLKQNVKIKDLEKYGFRILYNRYTGEPEVLEYGAAIVSFIEIKKTKVSKNLFIRVKSSTCELWKIDIKCLTDRKDEISDILYDLIKADLVDKWED